MNYNEFIKVPGCGSRFILGISKLPGCLIGRTPLEESRFQYTSLQGLSPLFCLNTEDASVYPLRPFLTHNAPELSLVTYT